MTSLCFVPSLALGTTRPRLTQSLFSPTSKKFLAKKTSRCKTPQMGWSGNIPEPGFPYWENQGADTAFARITGQGDIDMVTMAIDNPNEINQGYYRLVKGLSRLGDGQYSIASWGPRIYIPGWFSWENQGAGVAVVDYGPQKDIIVMCMDNPQRGNRPWYKIGYDMHSNGYTRGGWTDFMQIPGDFGWETQGAGIDVAAISNAGAKDLVVFYIDNPTEKNAAYYRVGYNMNRSGEVTDWSDRFEVPNWFSWENQGGGVAVFDVDGDGYLDIVVFFIDNPVEKNQAYYTVGRKLDRTGNVTGGWSTMKEVPGWFSWENQGGGIAINTFPAANPTLATYFIDNPRGMNSAYLKFGDEVF